MGLRGMMMKKILIYTDNFYPLQGGAEINLERIIERLIEDEYSPEVLTLFPAFSGDERNFKYPITRIISDKINRDSLENTTLSDLIWGGGQLANKFAHRINNDDNRPAWYVLLDNMIEYIENNGPYFAYIGCGQFGAKQVSFMPDIVEHIKNQNPSCKTFYLDFDIYHYSNPDGKLWAGEHRIDMNPLPHIDYLISLNYHDLNHESIDNSNIKVCLPPEIKERNEFNPNLDEWENRPYDFGFLAPIYHKGSSIVKNLLIDFPECNFLVKKPTYGTCDELDQIYPLIAHNFDVVDWVDNMDSDFYQQCRYILYPSLNEGYGLVPAEAILNGAIPLLNYSKSNYWVHYDNVYYIKSELNENKIPYNCDHYLNNYRVVNEAWTKEVGNILSKNNKIHLKFIKDTKNKVLKFHQDRYEKFYLKFKNLLEGNE